MVIEKHLYYDVPKTDNTKLALYVDDKAIAVEHENLGDICRPLQKHINSINWYITCKINSWKKQAILCQNKRLEPAATTTIGVHWHMNQINTHKNHCEDLAYIWVSYMEKRPVYWQPKYKLLGLV